MTKRVDWVSELRITQNEKTGKVFYYILKCDIWSRVSKADYTKRENDAVESFNYLTSIKGGLISHTKSIRGYFFSKASQKSN